jgi:hypothetical protein
MTLLRSFTSAYLPPEEQPLKTERYETLAADLEKEFAEKGGVCPLKVV